MNQRIFFVAGEASGDSHAAEVIAELKRLSPSVEVHAYGGSRMEAAGAELHYPFTDLASVGSDWIWNLFTYRRLGIQALEICKFRGIQTLVLVDFPGFNLRLATAAKRMGMRVIYYITPQVWAWKYGRVKRMRRDLDLALVILPFEEPLLRKAGIETQFVGHPLVDRLKERREPEEICAQAGLLFHPDTTLVGLLPGSRDREVSRLGPVLAETARLLMTRFEGLHFVIPRAETIPAERLEQFFPADIPHTLIQNPAPDLRSVLRMAVTKSGTSTLENAVLGVPQVIVYKGRALDAFVARRVVRVQWLGLVNILADREICPEFLQEECIPSRIAEKSGELIPDSPERRRMLEELRSVADSLGDGNSAERAARAILEKVGS